MDAARVHSYPRKVEDRKDGGFEPWVSFCNYAIFDSGSLVLKLCHCSTSQLVDCTVGSTVSDPRQGAVECTRLATWKGSR